MPHQKIKDDAIPASMWLILILINLSAINYGYVLVGLNACLAVGNKGSPSACFNGDDDANPSCPEGSIYDDLNLTTANAQVATSLVALGAWVGCLAGYTPLEVYGRKQTLLWNNLFFIAGALAAASGNEPLLYIGRLISGFGVGVTSAVGPVLSAEIAMESQRGRVTGLFPVFARFGMFATALVGYGFVENVKHGWQYVMALSALPAIVQLVFSYMIPESPKWLICTMDDRIEAKIWLLELRPPGHDLDKEIDEIYASNEKSMDAKDVSWSDVFEWKKAVELGIMLMIIMCQTGANSIFYYSSTIFGFAGFNDAILGTVIVNGVLCSVTVLSAHLVDTMGRKTLLMGGTWVMLAALITLSSVLWFGNGLGHTQGVIAVVAVVVFVMGWGIGLGAVAWVVMAELIPTHIRSKAYSLFVSMMWINSFIIGLLALTAIYGLGGVSASQSDNTRTDHQKTGCGIFYFIYSVLCALALLYMHYELPETKGADPETMRGNDEVSFSQSPVKPGTYQDNRHPQQQVQQNKAPKKKMYNKKSVAGGSSSGGGTLTESLLNEPQSLYHCSSSSTARYSSHPNPNTEL